MLLKLRGIGKRIHVSSLFMVNLKEDIRICKAIAFMLLLLFSLAPCSAKKSVFDSLNAGFGGSLNKSKTTISLINSCNTFGASFHYASISKSVHKLIKDRKPPYFRIANADIAASRLYVPSLIAGKKPPKYILFRQLKVHLA